MDVGIDVWLCRKLWSCEGGGEVAVVDVARPRISGEGKVEFGQDRSQWVFGVISGIGGVVFRASHR